MFAIILSLPTILRLAAMKSNNPCSRDKAGAVVLKAYSLSTIRINIMQRLSL